MKLFLIVVVAIRVAILATQLCPSGMLYAKIADAKRLHMVSHHPGAVSHPRDRS